MGFALAEAARDRGAAVTLVAGPTSIGPPAVDDLVRVRSARDMHEAVMARSTAADVIIMAAAGADYTPAGGMAPGKIAKTGPMSLALDRTRDILTDLGSARADRSRPVLVGVAAQTGDPVPAAREKLHSKRVALIVANDVAAAGSGFVTETNQITLVSREGQEPLALQSKRDAADAVLDRVERLLAETPAAQASR
jgi:phosphopantothenoylcysteine decarboxylase/phosphopantothenate--cysteine ligase